MQSHTHTHKGTIKKMAVHVSQWPLHKQFDQVLSNIIIIPHIFAYGGEGGNSNYIIIKSTCIRPVYHKATIKHALTHTLLDQKKKKL